MSAIFGNELNLSNLMDKFPSFSVVIKGSYVQIFMGKQSCIMCITMAITLPQCLPLKYLVLVINLPVTRE